MKRDNAMTRAELTSGEGTWTCSSCRGEKQGQHAIAVTIGEATIALCEECGHDVTRAIGDKLTLFNVRSGLTSAETTAKQVASFATYPLESLLDELVMCTVRYTVGPIDADERRIATALMERLAALQIARKAHRVGCEIWPNYRLCKCPWEVPA